MYEVDRERMREECMLCLEHAADCDNTNECNTFEMR